MSKPTDPQMLDKAKAKSRCLEVVLHIAPSPNGDLYIKCKRIDDHLLVI